MYTLSAKLNYINVGNAKKGTLLHVGQLQWHILEASAEQVL